MNLDPNYIYTLIVMLGVSAAILFTVYTLIVGTIELNKKKAFVREKYSNKIKHLSEDEIKSFNKIKTQVNQDPFAMNVYASTRRIELAESSNKIISHYKKLLSEYNNSDNEKDAAIKLEKIKYYNRKYSWLMQDDLGLEEITSDMISYKKVVSLIVSIANSGLTFRQTLKVINSELN